MFGASWTLLDEDQVSFISERSDFICIEKNHGVTVLGSAELGTKHEVEAFNAVNLATKTLFYFNSAYAWPFTYYTENFAAEKIDDYPELKAFLIKLTFYLNDWPKLSFLLVPSKCNMNPCGVYNIPHGILSFYGKDYE